MAQLVHDAVAKLQDIIEDFLITGLQATYGRYATSEDSRALSSTAKRTKNAKAEASPKPECSTSMAASKQAILITDEIKCEAPSSRETSQQHFGKRS